MSYAMQFLSGMLLINSLPHLCSGLSGSRFQTPFASPSGVGESSALVNVYWGFANFAGGAALLANFAPQAWWSWCIAGAGGLLLGTVNAIHFSKVRAAR